MSHRKEQVESTLTRVISQVLMREMSDPRLVGMISITHVDASPDLRQAKVYVSVLPEKYEKRTLAALRHASRHIHAKVSKRVALRMVPHLDFGIDPSIKKQAQIEAAINEGMSREEEEALHDVNDQNDVNGVDEINPIHELAESATASGSASAVEAGLEEENKVKRGEVEHKNNPGGVSADGEDGEQL